MVKLVKFHVRSFKRLIATNVSRFLFLIYFLALIQSASGNNIIVSNIHLVGKDISTGSNSSLNYVYVACDINWENSWRTSNPPNNWDAAWVFLKFRIGSNVWKHATLHTSAHIAPPGATLNTPTDGRGVFIYRSSDGTGNNNFTGIKIRWDYGTDGVLDTDRVQVKVLAIEMVYVPQGSLYVGTNGVEDGSFTNGSWRTGSTLPLHITSEAELTIDTLNETNLWGISSSGYNTIGPVGTLPANFPKGYNAFYCMKYSICQGQYVDFLNTLIYDQQASRTAVLPNSTTGTRAMYLPPTQSSTRNGIEIQIAGVSNTTPAVFACDLADDGSYNQNDDGKDIECNWISWADGIAYADWAGLRPMTELEFEKACRGSNPSMNNEFAWDTSAAIEPSSISNTGTDSEKVLPGTSNCNYTKFAGVQGPVRVGCFAGSSSTRQQAGGTFYGIMEMSGGVWERVVSVGDTVGRLFAGSHGDGSLDVNGDASGVSDWPGTNAIGSGFRGGVWDSTPVLLRVANRTVASFANPDRGGNSNTMGTRGFRAVRTAP